MNQAKMNIADVLADLKIEIEVETPHSWLVKAQFKKESLDSIEITTQLLRHIKTRLSEQINIPLNSLEYADTLENRVFESYVLAVFRIQIAAEQQGKPQLTILPYVTTDGVEYKDMIARLTLHPFDEDGKAITFDRVQGLLKQSRIQDNFLKQDAIAQQFEKTVAEGISQMAIVATGVFPESGKNAELEFFVSTFPDSNNVEDFQNTLKVNSGKMICKKTPKTLSVTRGADLYGNIVEGVAGLDIELEVGEGAMCSAQGLAVYALRDGVAQIQTYSRTIVSAKAKKNFIYKVHVMVVPLRVIAGDEKINLTTNDAIEVRGNLKSGSNISSTSSIIIAGNIEGQGYLSSGNSIIVQGNVHDSNLVSQKDASIQGSIVGSSVISKEQAQIGGSVKKSRIFTDQAISVRGNVDEKSIVMSTESVAIAGNVDPSSHIESHDNIMVNGNVGNAELVSDKNIVVDGSVSGGNISAKERVVIAGTISDTSIVADTIIAENACGSTLVANNFIKVKDMLASPDARPNEINIGAAHFSTKRLEQNQIVIANAEQSISKLGQYFGSEVLQQLEIENIHGALIQFMKSIRYVTNATMSLEEVTTSRKLLESIKPARDLISARKLENLILSKKIEKGSEEQVRLEIDGKIEGITKVNLNGSITELNESDKGNVVLTNDPKMRTVNIVHNE